MLINPIKAILLLSVAGLFLACEDEDKAIQAVGHESGNRDAAGYSKAWIQLKAKNLDLAARSHEMGKIAAEFGFSLPQSLSDPAKESPPTQDPSPKTGALPPVPPVQLPRTRDFDALVGRINSYYTHYIPVTVKNGETLTGKTTANPNNYDPFDPSSSPPPADPFMVAFYQSASTSDPNAYSVNVVAINDDIDQGNTNSSFSWKNNTGATKTVIVLSFVYAPESWGLTTARVTVQSGNFGKLIYQKERWISAAPKWDAKIPNTNGLYQAGPLRSKIKLTKGTGSVFGWGFGLLAINSSTMRGGFMFDTEGTLELPDVWTYGYPNLFLGIFEGKGTGPDDPTNYNYFLTELLDTYGLSAPAP